MLLRLSSIGFRLDPLILSNKIFLTIKNGYWSDLNKSRYGYFTKSSQFLHFEGKMVITQNIQKILASNHFVSKAHSINFLMAQELHDLESERSCGRLVKLWPHVQNFLNSQPWLQEAGPHFGSSQRHDFMSWSHDRVFGVFWTHDHVIGSPLRA